MDIALIGDEDTVLGFKLVGVKKTVVFNEDTIREDLAGFKDAKVLIITEKVAAGDLNFEDFLEQMKTVKKMGSVAKLASMIPGVREGDVDEQELRKVEAIINSMTKRERLNPNIIDGSRKRRIATGSGTTVRDVNKLLKQFTYTRDLLKKVGKGKSPSNFPFKF